MIKDNASCPVCGELNERIRYCTVDVVEQYYVCNRCTFFSKRAYSPLYSGIREDYPKQYADIVKEMKLEVYKKDDWINMVSISI